MKFPLVWIEWEDSAQPDSAWRFLEDLDQSVGEIVRCVSVGFLIHDGKDVKALTPNIGDASTPDAQASWVIRIPTRCVTRVERLRAPR